MSRKQILQILLLGGLAIGGIMLIQSYWVINSWYHRNSEFDEKVSIALRRVAEKMAVQSDSELPKEGLINRLSTNAYVVNYNNFIDPHILEDFLLVEMDAINMDTEFEYALYDCFTEELVYGNCCIVNDDDRDKVQEHVIQLEDLTYFFIVRFPNRKSFLLGQIWMFILFSVLSVMAIVAFLFAIRTIFRQKRLSELQKDFVNNMTHEFKTPLSSIRVSAMVIEGAREIRGNERLVKYAQIISEQSKRLSSQVENVLDIVRSEKKFEIKKEKIELISLIKDVLASENNRFDKDNLKIIDRINIESLQVEADKYHMSNVVSNIVENAVKYGRRVDDDEKELTLEVKLDTAKDVYLLSFKDNGMGIAENHQKLIFDKFYRIPTGNIHNVKGFGLGLYYVKNICQQHGFDISVESAPGSGSNFIIQIPQSKVL